MKRGSRACQKRFAVVVSLAALLCSLPAVQAQDSDGDPLLASESESTSSSSRFITELWLGQDHVSGLPNNRDNLDRTRARLRFGMNWSFADSWDFTATGRVAQGSDDNRDNRRNNDNERSDSFGIDQILLRWHDGEQASAQFGKAPLPLDLSPMLWDPDLRPAGFAYERSAALGDFNRLHWVIGYFAGQHLYGDDSRIGAAQMAFNWREGAPTRAGVTLSYLDFSDLDELTRQGLARTNAISAGRLVSDYRLLDLQLSGHTELGSWPIDLHIDLVRNLGADFARDGGRLSVSAGDHRKPGGFQVGLAIERIQREAVMAAFNSDDWWFHSNRRGQLLWVAYGIDETWRLRLSGFRELRDGLDEYTHRVLFDVDANW